MRSILILLIGGLLTTSCVFQFEEENFVEVSPDSNKEIEINLFGIPDTLNVTNYRTVNYALEIVGAPYLAIYLIIGDKVQYIGYSQTGSFVLSPYTFQLNESGYLPFEFVAFSTTGTGSMADLSQRELVVFSMKKILYFDLSKISPINISSIKEINGSIQLSWEKYPHDNLTTLKLRKTYYPTESSIPKEEIVLLNVNDTSYEDRYFLGSEIFYELISENNLKETATGAGQRFIARSSKISKYETVGGKFKITWNKPQLYANSVGYQLTGKYGNIIFSSTNLIDTVAYVDGLTLGQSLVLTLNTISIYSLYNTSFSTPVYIGTKILAPQKVLHDPLSETYYYLRSPYLIKDKLGILDSINVEFNEYGYASLDSDGKTIFLTNETTIQEISTENFVLKNSYTIPNPILSLLNFESNFLLATLAFSSSGHLSLFNKSTSAIQNYGLIQHWLNAFSKSKTPGYILGTGSGIYVFKVSEIGEIESYENVSGQIAVFNSDGNFIYVFDNLSKGKYSFPDLEFIEGSSTNLYLSELRGFDESNGYYAENTGNGLLIRSLETSEIIKRIYTPSNGYSFIKNGRAFCTVGAYSYYIDY